MNTQLKKNRLTVFLIFALSIIPFIIAWYFAQNPSTLHIGASNGDLILPPVSVEYSEFSGHDAFTTENLHELQGHWVLINLLPNNSCPASCQEALYKTRQITLMMGKDIVRIRRAAAMTARSGQPVLNGEWQTDAWLLKILLAAPLQQKIEKIITSPIPDGMLLLMDPLGNLMMKYPPGFDPYKVKNDLSKLLKISQIG